MKFALPLRYALVIVVAAWFAAMLFEVEVDATRTLNLMKKKWKQWSGSKGKARYFSSRQLKKYDGTNPNLPIYVALDGDVFDVSAGRQTYGPGGSYNHFAGVDHARAFVTGCFEEHKTHDLRGFTAKQLADLQNWKNFYKNHDKYFYVGKVVHPPIDPKSPIPPDCNASKKP